MIVIVDYKMGNLRSVAKAVELAGARCITSSAIKDIRKADKLIFPGVGAFKEAMLHINKLGIFEAVNEFIDKGRLFFGICLGMQLMFGLSYEGGLSKGFDKIEGSVKKFKLPGLKVPHMGWNRIQLKNKKCPLFRGVPSGSFMYFAHSYYGAPKAEDLVASYTDYGIRFASAAWKDNIFLTQFHPEKSQAAGLKIIKNFVKL